MRKTETCRSWVVYQMTIHGEPSRLRAVCEQAEWDQMESAHPGHHLLIQSGIANEGEAERLARGVPADGAKPKKRHLSIASPSAVGAAPHCGDCESTTSEDSSDQLTAPSKCHRPPKRKGSGPHRAMRKSCVRQLAAYQ